MQPHHPAGFNAYPTCPPLGDNLAKVRLIPNDISRTRERKEKQNKSLEYFKGGVSDVLFRGHRAADIMFRRSSDLVETELIK